MDYEKLKLDNQLCFPIYAASHLITREYKPHLEKLGITYPQYLVLMVLWETDVISVKEITQKLILNTNTVTPLLKRMETLGLITRQRNKEDERKVIIRLTKEGLRMREKAVLIPEKLAGSFDSTTITTEELINLRNQLNKLINSITEKK